MKASILFLVINLLFVSCTQKKLNPSVCGTSDPINDIKWLKERIKEKTSRSPAPFFTITAFEFEGRTVIADESPLYSTFLGYVFNCDGSEALKTGEHERYARERKKIRVLFDFDGKKAR